MQLNAREISFLNSSISLEGLTTIDYNHPRLQQKRFGYAGALLELKDLTFNKKPITVKHVTRWHTWLSKELAQYGRSCHPDHWGVVQNQVLTSPSASLNIWSKAINAVGVRILFMAHGPASKLFLEQSVPLAMDFLAQEPFKSANGLLCRLLLNYFCLLKNWPALEFKAHDHELFSTPQKSLRIWQHRLAETLRGAVSCPCSPDSVALRTHRGKLQDDYQCKKCSTSQKVSWKILHHYTS